MVFNPSIRSSSELVQRLPLDPQSYHARAEQTIKISAIASGLVDYTKSPQRGIEELQEK